MTGRALRAGLAVLACAATAALAPAAVAGASSSPEPTLTLERACGLRPAGSNYVDVILSGFPPFTPFEGTLEIGDGTVLGPLQLTTDENGSFDSGTIGHIGSFEPITFTATIVWEGGTLRESLFVDCSKPALTEDCKNGGWRDFPAFKNQGQCIAFVSGGKSQAGS